MGNTPNVQNWTIEVERKSTGTDVYHDVFSFDYDKHFLTIKAIEDGIEVWTHIPMKDIEEFDVQVKRSVEE